MAQRRISELIDDLIVLARDEHGVKGSALSEQLPRLGRLLPRKLRRDAKFLAGIEAQARHPKLMVQIDQPRARAACDRLHSHLRQIGAGRRRMDLLLSVLGTLAFGLLVLIGATVAILRWRGDL